LENALRIFMGKLLLRTSPKKMETIAKKEY
jgi:hypothetical protein